MKKLLSSVFACLLLSVAFGATAGAQTLCPPCYRNRDLLPGSDAAHTLPPITGCACATAGCPGCPGDNRRVLNIRIDPAWTVGTDEGQMINPDLWNAVTCAANNWNMTRGTNDEGIPYFLRIDQNDSTPDIVIKREAPQSGAWASVTHLGTSVIVNLSPNNLSNTTARQHLCGRLAHEFGHPVNLSNANTCTNPNVGFSIMAGSRSDGSRVVNDVQPSDVDAVRRQVFNRNQCTATATSGPISEDEDICDDNDGDGVTTCDGDCDDNDPGRSTNCGTGGCDPAEEWNCYNGGGDWDSGSCTCNYSSCDPWQEQDCYNQSGSWDPASCTCSGGACNPGPPVLVWTDSWSCSRCDCAGGDGTRETCTVYYYTYESYCQDGSLYSSWSEESSLYCGSSGQYCDDCWSSGCN